MSLTPSTMIALGTAAPDFELTDPSGIPVSRDNYTDHPLLVMFICNHCPYVKHVAPELARLGKDYGMESGGDLGIVEVSMKRGVSELELVEFCRRFSESSRAGGPVFEEVHYEANQGSRRIYKKAKRYVRDNENEPFFLLVHNNDAHDTYGNAIEVLRDPSHVRNHRTSQWQAMFSDAGFSDSEACGIFPCPLDFDVWTNRMSTPEPAREGLRALFAAAPSEVREVFHIDPAGHFWQLEIGVLVARKGLA